MRTSAPQPISESNASEQIQAIYDDIKKTFSIVQVPIMFQYLANYPSFFPYVWDSIKTNVQDPQFTVLTKTIKREILEAGHALLNKNPRPQLTVQSLVPDWEIQSKIASEIDTFLSLQCKLALITIAMREATKGWAIGAKYLKTEKYERGTSSYTAQTSATLDIRDMVLADSTAELTIRSDIQRPMITFVVFLHQEFGDLIYKEEYVYARVAAEQSLVRYIPNIPHPIHASYNEVTKLVHEKDQLTNLFYLLSEKFPTVHAIATLMWGYGRAMLPSEKD